MSIASPKTRPGSIFETLDTTRVEAAADAAVYLEFRQHGEAIVVSNVTIAGHAENWWLMKDGVAPGGFDSDSSDDALGMRDGQWCLQAPSRRHFNKFCWLEEDIAQLAPWQRTAAFDSLYAANEFEAQYRSVFVDHGKIIGWTGFLWKSRPRHLDRLESRIDERTAEIRELLIQQHHVPEQSHRMLIDDANEQVALDPEAESIFDADTLRALRVRCRRQKNEAAPTYFHASYGITPVPMQGEDGHATLLLIDPLQPVEVDMRKAMTSLQRRVAGLVSEGNSNREVAEVLDVSVNTVKYHLKRIYPIVGVSNRVELATFLTSG